MTATDPTEDFPLHAPPRRRGATIWRILVLAAPMMIGAFMAAFLNLTKTGILSHLDQQAALYTLALVQPAFILMLAFLEGLAITNQVFSSKSVSNWPLGDVPRATRALSILGGVIVLILTAALHGAGYIFAGAESPMAASLPPMGWFVLSMLPFLWFELRNGALRGQGRTMAALVPYTVLAVVDLGVTWVALTQFDLGFNAILLGNAVGPLVALPIVTIMLNRTIGAAKSGPDEAYRKHLIGLVIGVAGPVGLTMLAGSASAAVIFPALASIGQDATSAFLVIIRMRILFMIPAISIGSALAIIVNQLPERGHAGEKREILITGLLGVTLVYLAATVALHFERSGIVSLVVPQDQAALNAVTQTMVATLIATFFLLALATMTQVILEHLGQGIKAFVATVLIEVVTIAACLWALWDGRGLDGLMLALNGVAVLGAVLFLVMFVLVLRKIERVSDAV